MTNTHKHIPQGYESSPLGIIPEDWEHPGMKDFRLPSNKGLYFEHNFTDSVGGIYTSNFTDSVGEIVKTMKRYDCRINENKRK